MNVEITWVDHQREPQSAPNPKYPLGIDVDVSDGAAVSCKIALDYPARRCGYYVVRCKDCGTSVAVTTAGRVDDPRSVTVACKGKQ
jgi:hypothetical protein